VKQRTRSERPTFSPFVVPLFHQTFRSEQATLKNVERMYKSERIRRSVFFYELLICKLQYLPRNVGYIRLFSTIMCAIVNEWLEDITATKLVLNAFIAPPLSVNY